MDFTSWSIVIDKAQWASLKKSAFEARRFSFVRMWELVPSSWYNTLKACFCQKLRQSSVLEDTPKMIIAAKVLTGSVQMRVTRGILTCIYLPLDNVSHWHPIPPYPIKWALLISLNPPLARGSCQWNSKMSSFHPRSTSNSLAFSWGLLAKTLGFKLNLRYC